MKARVAGVLAAAFLLIAAATVSVAAQTPQEVTFDRPEAWGQKWAAAVAFNGGWAGGMSLDFGQLELGGELMLIPNLSDDQRRIGFDGIKLEDMNKSPVFGRVRARLGLGRSWSAGVGFVPPVPMGGATPLMVGASLQGPVWTGPVQIGIRGHGQWSRFSGDITCDAETVAAGTDPIANPFACEAVSDDELRQVVGGLELQARKVGGSVEPFAAVGLMRIDSEFQVDAQYSGARGDDLIMTDGTLLTVAAGISLAASDQLSLELGALYVPMDVVRPPQTAAENDALFTIRGGISYRVR